MPDDLDAALVELSRLAGDVTVRAWPNRLVAVTWTQDGLTRTREGYTLHTALRRALRDARTVSEEAGRLPA